MCIPAFASIHPIPQECNTEITCIGTNNVSDILETNCNCGFNPSAKKYCDVFMGDPAGVAYIAAYNEFVANGGMDVCNTVARYDTQCWDVSIGTNWGMKLLMAKIQFFFTPMLVDNDDCIKNTLTAYYWHLNGVVLAIGSLLFLN